MKTMINAFEYGKALFLLAKEEENAEQIMEQICAVSELMKTEPDYCKLLDTPAIATNEKPKLIDEAFKGVHIYVLNFLKIFSLTLRFGSKLSERWNFSSACFSSFDNVSGI